MIARALRVGKTQANYKRTYLDKFLKEPGPFADESFVPGEDTIQAVEAAKVLSVRWSIPLDKL